MNFARLLTTSDGTAPGHLKSRRPLLIASLVFFRRVRGRRLSRQEVIP